MPPLCQRVFLRRDVLQQWQGFPLVFLRAKNTETQNRQVRNLAAQKKQYPLGEYVFVYALQDFVLWYSSYFFCISSSYSIILLNTNKKAFPFLNDIACFEDDLIRSDFFIVYFHAIAVNSAASICLA